MKIIQSLGRKLLSNDWPVLPFQPILYLALFLGVIHVTLISKTPIPFDEHFVPGFGYIWAGLLIGSILLSGASAWMIFCRSGRWRYAGFWLRLGGDVGVLCALIAFDISTWATLTDEQIFRHFVFGSVGTFVCFLILRDVTRLIAVERIANKIHRSSDRE